MPDTQSPATQTNPQGGYTWESVPNPQRTIPFGSQSALTPLGYTPLPGFASTVTIQPLSQLSAREGTESIAIAKQATNAACVDVSESPFADARAKLDEL